MILVPSVIRAGPTCPTKRERQGTFNITVRFRTMSDSLVSSPSYMRHQYAGLGAYIVTMRNASGSPEAYYVTGRDEQHAIDRAARISGLKPGQVIGITRA